MQKWIKDTLPRFYFIEGENEEISIMNFQGIALVAEDPSLAS